jgi:glutathione transport system substrate-binding protein
VAGRRVVWLPLFGLAVAAVACGGPSQAATTTTTTYVPWVTGTGGTMTLGIDQAPTGCNPNSALGNTWADHLVLEAVLPSAFVVDPSDSSVYDSAVITQAELQSTSPQRVVYTINPKAVWSDGQPITATDFIYAWQQQRGGADDDGVPGGGTASILGYRDIKSIKGSNHGRTVTVVFKTPYADWQALFNDLLPAHVMEQAGWDPGCSTVDPAIDLSGGPFEISSVTANQIVLARNPKWWGQAPYLDRFVIRIADSPTQLTNWVTSGQVEVVAPTSYGQDFLEQVSGDPTLDSNSSVSSSFLQLEFSTTSPVTATVGVREGIAHAVDRQTLVDTVVGWDNTGIVPSASHLYSQSQGTYPSPRTPALQFSGQPGYTPPATSATPTPAQPFPSTDDPSITDDDLTDAGYVRGPTGAWELPTGAPLTVKVAIDEGDAWAAQTGTLLVQQLQTAGIGTTTVLADSTAAAGMDLATGAVDAAVLPFTSTPYPTQAIAWYTPLLGPPGHDGSENWSNFDDPTLNSLLTKAAQQLNPNTASPLYTQADALLWKQMVALPLFAEPSAMAWSAYTSGVGPNPNGANLLWFPQDWAVRVPPTSQNTVPGSS